MGDEPTMLGMLQGFLGVGGDGVPVAAAPGAAAAVPPVVAQLVRPMAAQMAAATAALPSADDVTPAGLAAFGAAAAELPAAADGRLRAHLKTALRNKAPTLYGKLTFEEADGYADVLTAAYRQTTRRKRDAVDDGTAHPELPKKGSVRTPSGDAFDALWADARRQIVENGLLADRVTASAWLWAHAKAIARAPADPYTRAELKGQADAVGADGYAMGADWAGDAEAFMATPNRAFNNMLEWAMARDLFERRTYRLN